MLRWFVDNWLRWLSDPPEKEIGHCVTRQMADVIDVLTKDRDLLIRRVQELEGQLRTANDRLDVCIEQRDRARATLYDVRKRDL